MNGGCRGESEAAIEFGAQKFYQLVATAMAEMADEAALLAWLAMRIARYKLPRRVVFWDRMPKSGYGKITKKMIREALVARGEIAP